MKKIKLGLFAKIVIAILLGALLGEILPMAGVRVLKTFNVFFAGLLKFIVPLLVIGLVTPAIADVGKGAGKMLLAVMAISYFSTVCAGFFGYAAGSFAFPHYLAKGLVGAGAEAAEIQPFFTIKILPICDVLTALALSFMTGIGIVFTGSKWLRGAVDDFGEVVKLTILKAIIPFLPVYILTMISEMTASGKAAAMAEVLFKVIGTGMILTIIFLACLYVVIGLIVGKNPFRCIWNMLPAYFTGFSICSSAASIPVTLESTLKMGVSKDIAGFVIPLCANVHMVGSATKLCASAMAIIWMADLPVGAAQFAHFIFMLGIAAVAAPGVTGGVLMASLGLVDSVLGFSPEQSALLMTFYLAIDGYGPAANVTGDGAIALVIDRFFGAGRKG